MTFSAPWECDDDLRTIFDASGAAVAFLPIPPDPTRTRLLLAAPALYKALKAMIEDADVTHMPNSELSDIVPRGATAASIIQARALIAEIRGDGE